MIDGIGGVWPVNCNEVRILSVLAANNEVVSCQ